MLTLKYLKITFILRFLDVSYLNFCILTLLQNIDPPTQICWKDPVISYGLSFATVMANLQFKRKSHTFRLPNVACVFKKMGTDLFILQKLYPERREPTISKF